MLPRKVSGQLEHIGEESETKVTNRHILMFVLFCGAAKERANASYWRSPAESVTARFFEPWLERRERFERCAM